MSDGEDHEMFDAEITTKGAKQSSAAKKRGGVSDREFADGGEEDSDTHMHGAPGGMPLYGGPPLAKRPREGQFIDRDGHDDDKRLEIVRAARPLTLNFPMASSSGFADTYANVTRTIPSSFAVPSMSSDMMSGVTRSVTAPNNGQMFRFPDRVKKDDELQNFMDVSNTAFIPPARMMELCEELYRPLEGIGKDMLERFIHREKAPIFVDRRLRDRELNPTALGVLSVEAFNLVMRTYYHGLYTQGKLEEDMFKTADQIRDRFEFAGMLNNLQHLPELEIHATQTGGIAFRGSVYELPNYWKAYPHHTACMTSLGFAVMKVNMKQSAKWELITCDDPAKYPPLMTRGAHDRVPSKKAQGETTIDEEELRDANESAAERRARKEREAKELAEKPENKDWYAWQMVPVLVRDKRCMTNELTVGTRGLGVVYPIGLRGMYQRESGPSSLTLHQMMQSISPPSVQDVTDARLRQINSFGGISVFINIGESCDDPEPILSDAEMMALESDSSISLHSPEFHAWHDKPVDENAAGADQGAPLNMPPQASRAAGGAGVAVGGGGGGAGGRGAGSGGGGGGGSGNRNPADAEDMDTRGMPARTRPAGGNGKTDIKHSGVEPPGAAPARGIRNHATTTTTVGRGPPKKSMTAALATAMAE